MNIAKVLSTQLLLFISGSLINTASADVLTFFRDGERDYLLTVNSTHGPLSYQNDTHIFELIHNNRTFSHTTTNYQIFVLPGTEITATRIPGQQHISLFRDNQTISIANLDIINKRHQSNFILFNIESSEHVNVTPTISIRYCPDENGARLAIAFLFRLNEQQTQLYIVEYFPDGRSSPNVLLATSQLPPVYKKMNIDELSDVHVACVEDEILLIQAGLEVTTDDEEEVNEYSRGVFWYQITGQNDAPVPEDGVAINANSPLSAVGELQQKGRHRNHRLLSLQCSSYDKETSTLYISGLYLTNSYRSSGTPYLYLLYVAAEYLLSEKTNSGNQGIIQPLTPIPASSEMAKTSSIEKLEYCSFEERALKSVLTVRTETLLDDNDERSQPACTVQTIVSTLPLDRLPNLEDFNQASSDAPLLNTSDLPSPSEKTFTPVLCPDDIHLMPVSLAGVGSFITSAVFTTGVILYWKKLYRGLRLLIRRS